MTLKFKSRRRVYEFDLERCTSSAEILDWIFQFAGKDWGSGEDMADLIRAIRDTLNPQRNFCSWGLDTKYE